MLGCEEEEKANDDTNHDQETRLWEDVVKLGRHVETCREKYFTQRKLFQLHVRSSNNMVVVAFKFFMQNSECVGQINISFIKSLVKVKFISLIIFWIKMSFLEGLVEIFLSSSDYNQLSANDLGFVLVSSTKKSPNCSDKPVIVA